MLANNFKVSKYELITLVVSAGAGRNEYYFTDQPNLRQAQIQSISVYAFTTFQRDPNDIPLISDNDIRISFLVLNINDKEDIKIPMVTLMNIGAQGAPVFQANTSNGYMPFAGQIITWPKSYVKFPIGHAATQFSIVIGVFYK
jgi:hypothetical protein